MKPGTKEKKYLIKEFDRHGYKLTFSQSKNRPELWEVEDTDIYYNVAICGNNINTLKELLQRVSEGKKLL